MNNKQEQYWNHFVAGLVGGLLSVTICHPLEVARSRLNLQNGTISIHKYDGFLHALKLIFREEGFKGFYNGYNATIVANPLFHSLFFPIYKYSKTYLNKQWNIHGFYNHITATVFTGFVCDLMTNPLWVNYFVEIKLVGQNKNADTISPQIKEIHIRWLEPITSLSGGFFALYKGLGATVLGLSHVAVQFPIYEQLRNHYLETELALGPMEILKASIISKSIAVVATYPHVVIRTRLHDNKTIYRGDINQRVRILSIVRTIWGQDGIKGFYQGLVPDLVRVLPTNSITFLVYELFSGYLNEKF